MFVHRTLDAYAQSLNLSNAFDYGRFLVANAAPLTALEHALERGNVQDLLADWPARSRRGAIDHDLRLLGLSTPRMTAQALEGVSAQLGVLYVLEGSRLGAQVMLRQVAASPDLRVRSALHFLSAGNSNLWPRFLHTLESVESVDADVMTQAARHAFELFSGSFATLRSAPAVIA